MNDKLIMELYLMLLKSTVEVYVHGTLESSNKSIRKYLKNGLNTILDNQANTYEVIANNGWYNVKNIKENEIKKIYDKLS